MDLLAILSSLRRHWILALTVTLMTVAGGVAVLTLTPRVYNSNASFVLVNPKPQPTEAQILADPSLADVNWDNPYLRFASEGTVGQVLAARLSSSSVRESLAGQGADRGYKVTQSPVSAQIIDVVGTGSSAAEADATLELVNRRMAEELAAMQKVYGADDRTLITLLTVAPPTQAHLVVSGTIRTLVGVGAAGALLLFAAISLGEARRHAREETVERTSPAMGGTHARAQERPATRAGAAPHGQADVRSTGGEALQAPAVPVSAGRASRHDTVHPGLDGVEHSVHLSASVSSRDD